MWLIHPKIWVKPTRCQQFCKHDHSYIHKTSIPSLVCSKPTLWRGHMESATWVQDPILSFLPIIFRTLISWSCWSIWIREAALISNWGFNFIFLSLFGLLFLLVLLIFLKRNNLNLRWPILWQRLHFNLDFSYWFLFSFEWFLPLPFEKILSPFVYSFVWDWSSSSLILMVDITASVVIFSHPYFMAILTSLYASRREFNKMNDSFSSPILSPRLLNSEDSFLKSLRLSVKDFPASIF